MARRKWVTEGVAVAEELRHEWYDDRVSGLAAEVAFFGLLGLFPTLLVMAATLDSLDAVVGQEVAARAEEQVLDFLRRVLTDEAGGTIDAVRDLFTGSDTGFLTLGIVVSLLGASRAFKGLVHALDVAYDLDERRSWLNLRLTALGLALGSAVVGSLILAMLVVGPLLGTGQDVADAIGAGQAFATFWDWVRWPTVVVLIVLWAATVFHLAPNHRTPWRSDVPGAVLTALLWALASLGFRAYLVFAAQTNEVLGALGGTLIMLIWLYLMSLGLLLGGEFNALLLERSGGGRRPRAE